jgi:hypothetical protein
MKRQQSAHRTLRFALFLGIIIILVILAAIVVKIAIVLQRSTFDGQQQFILQIQHPKSTELLIFYPGSVSLTDIMLSQAVTKDMLIKKYALPVDGAVTISEEEQPKDFTRSLLFHFNRFHPTITFFDAIRLFLFSQGVIGSNIHQDKLALPLDTSLLQQKVNKDFMDTTLYKESISVAIVNAAGVSGLGNNVALLLSHIGVNIISVTSSQKVSTRSFIAYTGQRTYTLQRLQQILHFPVQASTTTGVANVTITIGTDTAERFAP